MASFPGGMPIRRAGPMPQEQPQGNIYSDIGQGLRQTAGDVEQYSQRQDAINNMVYKRKVAANAAAAKAEYDQKNMEFREAEFQMKQEGAERKQTQFEQQQKLEETERGRKEKFYDRISKIPSDAPNKKELIEQAAFEFQQVDPGDIYGKLFPSTQGPAARVMFDAQGHPWQLSRTEGRTKMLPYTVPGGGPSPTKFVPPKPGQPFYDDNLKAFLVEPGETIARPVVTPEGKQLTRPILSPKQIANVKGKVITISLAKKQLGNIIEKFKGGLSFGAWGQGFLPTEVGKQFDAAVDAMRQTFRKLTRTPGEGAMSDFETRLGNASLPNRTDYESVTSDKIRYLEELLDTLNTGYAEMGIAAKPKKKMTTEKADKLMDALRRRRQRKGLIK